MAQNNLPTVSIDLARMVIRYATDIGLDADHLWRQCGLDPLQEGGGRIPAHRFEALWRAVEAQSGDEHFGLLLGRAVIAYAGGHLLYAVLLNSPTVEAALTKFCRYHGILSDLVQPRLICSSGRPAIRLDAPLPLAQRRLNLGQEAFIFSLFASILRNLTGRGDTLSEVRFSNAPPREMAAFQNAFECPIRFQCRESALLPLKQVMGQPLFHANPHLLAGYEEMAFKCIGQLSENPIRHETARAIGRMLARGEKPAIDAVAGALALSTRRLQQKLKSEQTGYREILDLVRKETALRLLQNPERTISEITFLLGFSEQSGFTHAFQSWTGTTPGKYRKDRSKPEISNNISKI